MPTLRFEHESAGPHAVTIERLPGAGDGGFCVQTGSLKKEVHAVQPAPGKGWFLHHGRVVAFHAVRTESGVELWHDGRRICLTLTDGRARRSGTAHAADRSDQLAAPMPGTVLKIHARAGESFEAHQPLIILESMKMELTLSSPHAGRVMDVPCKVGELVTMGAILMRFEAGINE